MQGRSKVFWTGPAKGVGFGLLEFNVSLSQ